MGRPEKMSDTSGTTGLRDLMKKIPLHERDLSLEPASAYQLYPTFA
jgi:hypothetical protein